MELNVSLERLERVHTGQPGGSQDAQIDLQSFFDRSIALGEWAAGAVGISLNTLRLAVCGLPGPPWIAISRDLAIASKHSRRDGASWSGDPNVRLASQNATVFTKTIRARGSVHVPGQGAFPRPTQQMGPIRSAHSWSIGYTPPSTGVLEKLSALDVARGTVTQWEGLLGDLGLRWGRVD